MDHLIILIRVLLAETFDLLFVLHRLIERSSLARGRITRGPILVRDGSRLNMLKVLKETLEINRVGGPQQVDKLLSFNTQTRRMGHPLLLLVRFAPILNN